MANRTRSHHKTKATLCASTLIFGYAALFSQETSEPDPWFNKKHEAPAAEEEAAPDPDAPTVIIRKTSPAALVKKLQKSLDLIPQGDLSRRINLLEEIISTDKPDEADTRQLAQLKQLKQNALDAIQAASATDLPLEKAIASLAPFSAYYTADPSLLVKLLESNFSARLNDKVSSLGRKNDTAEILAIQSNIQSSGLATVYGSRIQNSVAESTGSMIANRLDELTSGANTLPGESYLISRLLNQSNKKLGLAIELPANVDPKLANNITRSIENVWGNSFQVSDPAHRGANPEFILKIDVGNIRSSHTTSENQVTSEIPGAIIEEPNPDFLKLVEKYEKSAKVYEAAVSSFEANYQRYLEDLDDTEYRQAQNDLKQATDLLNSTPPPSGPDGSPAYDAAQAQFSSAQAMANSVSAPIAIEPQKPYPHHLKILDDLYLVPSTIIISEERTPYEYTKKDLDYRFESEAPLTLASPALPQVQEKSVVTLAQNRKWTQSIGTDPRDPSASEGTFSEDSYRSALDIFGLEFSSDCARELGVLLENAKSDLQAPSNAANPLPQALLLVAIETATSPNTPFALSESELKELANLAQNPETSSTQFRARCLARLLAKTQFAHLANEEKIAQYL